ncbi:hypothetical protein ACFLW2_05270 [Chloroflexota bacterium]
MSSNISRLDLNVLPDGYRRRRLPIKKVLLFLGISAAILLAFLVYQLTRDAMNKTGVLQDEASRLTQQAELRRIDTDKITGMTNTLREYDTISGMRGIFTEDIEAINITAEECGIQIITIAQEEEATTIFCQAPGHSTFDSYRQNFEEYCDTLVETDRFSSAYYPPLNFPPIASVSIALER